MMIKEGTKVKLDPLINNLQGQVIKLTDNGTYAVVKWIKSDGTEQVVNNIPVSLLIEIQDR